MKLVHLLQRPRHPLYKPRSRNGNRVSKSSRRNWTLKSNS